MSNSFVKSFSKLGGCLSCFFLEGCIERRFIIGSRLIIILLIHPGQSAKESIWCISVRRSNSLYSWLREKSFFIHICSVYSFRAFFNKRNLTSSEARFRLGIRSKLTPKSYNFIRTKNNYIVCSSQLWTLSINRNFQKGYVDSPSYKFILFQVKVEIKPSLR